MKIIVTNNTLFSIMQNLMKNNELFGHNESQLSWKFAKMGKRISPPSDGLIQNICLVVINE